MSRALPLALACLLLPAGALAAAPATFTSGNSVLLSTSTPGNSYAWGGTVTVTAPVAGDLSASGGTVLADAPVAGDALLAGGTVAAKAPVAGDLRALGGSVTIVGAVGGDVVALGGSVEEAGGGRSVYVVAAEAAVAGAKGPVTVYANNVALSGTFSDDVRIVALGRVSLASTTVIRGALTYEAPEEASIPASARIEGGVHYTGASYLPSSGEAHALALASFGIFLFFKILGSLLLAGLLTGLFPEVAQTLADRTRSAPMRRALLSILLGFAELIVAPALALLLALTFVGLGLALLLAALYVLFLTAAFVGGAVVLGALIASRLFKRTELRAGDAVLGMLVLYLIWTIPWVGWPFVFLLTIYALGALSYLAYHFAFPPRDGLNESEL